MFVFGVLVSVFSFHLSMASPPAWLISKAPHTAGPNCWNAALVQVGVLKTHRFSHPNEFLYLLEKNCHLTLEPQLGSLGRMWDDRQEVHAFVWVDAQTIYAKHSDGQFDNLGYELMDVDVMFKSYLIKKECAMNPQGKNCRRQIAYYECTSPPKELAQQILQLQRVESLLKELVFSEDTKMRNGDDCSSPGYFARNQVLSKLEQALAHLQAQEVTEPEYLQVWLQSVVEQVNRSRDNTKAHRCKNVPSSQKLFWYQKIKDQLVQMQKALQLP